MATNLKTAKRTLELAEKYPEKIVCAIGRHPWGAHKITPEELAKFEELIKNPRVKIIGEIGLDHYFIKEPEKWRKQQELFEFFLKLAERYKKPVILHSTGAEQNLVELLETWKLPRSVCCHWFSGSEATLKRLIDLGCFFSINPAVRRSKRHQRVVSTVALEWFLTESDGPVKFAGEVGTPLLMPFVCEEIARIKKIDNEQVVLAIEENFVKFLQD